MIVIRLLLNSLVVVVLVALAAALVVIPGKYHNKYATLTMNNPRSIHSLPCLVASHRIDRSFFARSCRVAGFFLFFLPMRLLLDCASRCVLPSPCIHILITATTQHSSLWVHKMPIECVIPIRSSGDRQFMITSAPGISINIDSAWPCGIFQDGGRAQKLTAIASVSM